MAANRLRREIEKLLARADVKLDGGRPWDIQVHKEALFRRVVRRGSLGLGEAYMDGWWDCLRLDELFARLLRAGLQDQVKSELLPMEMFKAVFFNLQSPLRAFRIGRAHYDLGNDLFRRMLDSRMIYSCGYWKNADNLEAAQEAKLDLVARKLGLAPGMKVLDIGCGWGGAGKFLAERYQVEVTGITVSERQAEAAKELCRDLPVEIRLEDYRSLNGRFDRIYSLGMFEHVGRKNYRTFLQLVRKLLAEDGLFLLHTIGSERSGIGTDPWIHRYIFPDGMLPSAKQITSAAEGRLVLEDWHEFGADYDRTLLCWFERFENAWPDLKDRYDERFHRMWKYYLLSCAGSFRARHNQLWQIVFSPDGLPGGYRAVR